MIEQTSSNKHIMTFDNPVEFASGAIRDSTQGKGRFDLISPIALRCLAIIYEMGGLQKGDRNWENGFPMSRCLDSATRHINQLKEGLRDEDHSMQAAWNLFTFKHFEVMIQRGLLPEKLDDLTPEQFWNSLDRSFWADLDWMPDGQEILRVVEDFFGKDNICLLTSPTLNPESASGKMDWIKRNMPDYSRQFLVGSAKKFCASHDAVLIDDADHNYQSFIKAGGGAVLVPRKWNSRYADDNNTIEVLSLYITKLMEANCEPA